MVPSQPQSIVLSHLPGLLISVAPIDPMSVGCSDRSKLGANLGNVLFFFSRWVLE